MSRSCCTWRNGRRSRTSSSRSALPSAGRTIFETSLPDWGVPVCARCHGPQAAGQAGFPRLAGQHANYLVKQLQVSQRSDDRPAGAMMKVVAHDLTAQEIENVAGYLQTLPSSR